MNLDRKAVKLCEQLLKSNGDRISDEQYTVARMRNTDVMSKWIPEAEDALKQFIGEHSMWCSLQIVWGGYLFEKLGPDTDECFLIIEYEG